MNATINLENKHFPVLLNELISIISPLYGGTFIDCTFGQGGYSEKILENKKVDAIIFDLGISSIQLLNMSRGFSFKSKDNLDMSMGLSSLSAKEILNNYNLDGLHLDYVRYKNAISYYLILNLVDKTVDDIFKIYDDYIDKLYIKPKKHKAVTE